MFYASDGSEILGIDRATANLTKMVTRVNLLLIWMKMQGRECEKDLWKTL